MRKPVDATAVSTMMLLCLAWGIGHVAAKLAAPGIPLVLQAGLRSVVATVLLLAWAHYRGVPLWQRDGALGGVLVLGEPLTVYFGVAVLLVGAGILVMNLQGWPAALTCPSAAWGGRSINHGGTPCT